MNFSGLQRIGYSETTDPATATWIPSRITADSNIDPQVTATEHTVGRQFGGGSAQGTIGLYSMLAWETLQKMMRETTERYWFFEYQDGRTRRTAMPLNIFVFKGNNPNARDGAVAMLLSFEHYHHQAAIQEI